MSEGVVLDDDDSTCGALGAVADCVDWQVPCGGRVLVVSDLHLTVPATGASAFAAEEISLQIEAWDGPGLIVLGGDCFELIGHRSAEPVDALAAHSRVRDQLAHFAAGAGRALICLAGNHDGALASDPRLAAQVRMALGARMGLAAEITFLTSTGERRVRVEHGHQLDPHNRFQDPRSPLDTPIGSHVVTDLLPALQSRGGEWLTGVEQLPHPGLIPRFVASRLVYRRLLRHAWWLVVPVMIALLVRFPLRFALSNDARVTAGTWTRRGAVVAATALTDIALVGIAMWAICRRAWRSLSQIGLGARGYAKNNDVRTEACRLVATGYTGLITGHTHHPQLTDLGEGFYANTGCGTEVVDELDGNAWLPAVFLTHRELSWVELHSTVTGPYEAAPELQVTLRHAREDLGGGTRLERFATRRRQTRSGDLESVAVWPSGADWPAPVQPARRGGRVRLHAAVACAVIGAADIVSAVRGPLRARLGTSLKAFPGSVPDVATVGVALCGVLLVCLASRVRRGQRQAWRVAVGIFVAAAACHDLRGVGRHEAVVSVTLSIWLLSRRGAFTAAAARDVTARVSPRPSLRGGLVDRAVPGQGEHVEVARRGRHGPDSAAGEGAGRAVCMCAHGGPK